MTNFDLNQRNASMYQSHQGMTDEQSPVIRKAVSHGVQSNYFPLEFSIYEPRVHDHFENPMENEVGSQC